MEWSGDIEIRGKLWREVVKLLKKKKEIGGGRRGGRSLLLGRKKWKEVEGQEEGKVGKGFS